MKCPNCGATLKREDTGESITIRRTDNPDKVIKKKIVVHYCENCGYYTTKVVD